jgi:hypothetical protein
VTEATLLNRLRRYGYGQNYGPMAKACAEAAVEIEYLLAENQRLRRELRDKLYTPAPDTSK